MAAMASAYPVTFEVAYPEQPRRWMILVRWLLAIPQLFVSAILSDLAQLLAFLAFFAILFTKRYPEGLFRLVAGCQRWQYNVMAYVLFQDGQYPPFSFDDGVYRGLTYRVERQQEYSRWLPLVKWLLAIPHLVVLAVLSFLAVLAYLVIWVAVLVTGRYPRGLFDFVVGVGRWCARVTAYLYLQVDRYPPFSLR
jgi:hypothetical protein